jgi:hypothetical protein
MRAAFAATGLLAVLSASGSQAATEIVSTLGNAQGSMTQTMFLDGNNLKMDRPSGAMLYRGGEDKVFEIDNERHTYLELSPEAMAKTKAKMDASLAQMRQQMQQQIAAMPEAQRKQVEAMMAARGLPGLGNAPVAPPVISYQKNGAMRKVGKWDCQPYSLLSDGKPRADLCIAKLSDLGLTRDDLKPFVGFSMHIAKQMTAADQRVSPMTPMNFDALNKAIGFDGYPVETVYKLPTGPEIKTTVQSVERKDMPAGSFDLPAGFTKHEMGAPADGSDK